MKNFLKMTAATLVGLILFSVVSTIFGFMFLGIIAASSDTATVLKPKSVYELNLSGSIVDRVESDEYAELMSLLGSDSKTMGLDDLQKTIRIAKENSAIEGIYLNVDGLSASPAAIQALRDMLVDFKESGKFIVAYADMYGQYGYWLSSVADKMYLNPQGNVNITGVNMQTMFVTETLEKLGIKMQVFKVGTYKSAVEPYTETKMSAANKEQMLCIAEGIWGQLKEHVASSRHIEQSAIQQFADNGGFLKSTEYALEMNLIDSLCYESDMEEVLKALVGEEPKSYSFNKMKKVTEEVSKKGDRIAVLYASGAIDGGSTGDMVSSDIVDELNELAENDKVKAVVLRVNSPGGSAFGSEQMWHAAEKLREKKPLVVSMGGYAASGGYYMSCNANKIVAEPTTLTGSIGIFGVFPDAQGLIKKVGLNFDGVGTAKFSDFGDITRPMSAGEKALMQNYIERGYELFVKRCADGRGLSVDSIKALAQGRVWLGTDAVRVGLVDELGGLNRAVGIAAELIESEKYYTRSYPAKKDIFTKLMEDFQMSAQTSVLKSALGSKYSYFEALNSADRCMGVQARIPYTIFFD